MEYNTDFRYIMLFNNIYYVVKFTGCSDNYYKFKTQKPTSDDLYNYSSWYNLSMSGIGRTLKISMYDIDTLDIIQI